MRRSASTDGRASTGGRPSLAPLRVKNDNGPGTGMGSKPKGFAGGSRPSYGAGIGASGSRPSYAGIGASGSRSSFGTGRQSYGMGMGTSSDRSRAKSRLGPAPMEHNKRSRSSMAYYGSHHEQLKDPRPVKDPSFKSACVRKLIEFLTEQKYPYPLSVKMLQSPTSNDFVKIFEFLVGHFHPKYKCVKMDEEIPRLMRSFGYPFHIPKSSMSAVGSPHTWPILLAALTWLRERIELGFTTDVDSLLYADIDGDVFDKVPEEKILFQYIEQSYREFMNGNDDLSGLDQELEHKIRENVAGENLDDLVDKNTRLREELARLEQQPDELRGQEKVLHNLQTDLNTLSDYNANLVSHKQQQEIKLNGLMDELARTDAELKQVKADNVKKQHIRDTQEYSPADILRINEGRERLQRSIHALTADCDDIDKKVWDLEMAISKEQDKIEEKCRQFNQIGMRLQMIPQGATNACGVDYELKPSTVHMKFATTVKPALVCVLKQCEGKMDDVQQQIEREELHNEQLQDMQSLASNTIKGLETKYRRVLDLLESNKEKYQRECEQTQSELDEMEQEVAALRKPDEMSLHEASKAIKEDKAKYERLRQERAQQIRQYKDFLLKVVTMVVDHKEAIQKGATQLTSNLEARLVQLKEDEKTDPQ